MSKISKSTRKLVGARGPAFPSLELATSNSANSIEFVYVTDGTQTIAQLVLRGTVVGSGVSRRRPGDPRNPELGMQLAMSRAFADAAARYAKGVDEHLNPGEDMYERVAKSYRRETKADAKIRKDDRRKAAREAHRAATGWDHTTYAAKKADANAALNRRAD